MNSERNSETEREPHGVADFTRVARSMSLQDGLFLLRNQAIITGVTGTRDILAIQYDDLERNPEGDEPLGRLVTSEFNPAASTLLGEYSRTGQPKYPKITVLDGATEKTAIADVNIARLILNKKVTVYSLQRSENDTAEQLLVDFAPLVYELSEEVGIHPRAAAVVTADRTDASLRDVAPVVTLSVPDKDFVPGGDDLWLASHRRGEAVLCLLQYATTDAFRAYDRRVVRPVNPDVGVELFTKARSYTQVPTIDLIDLLEHRGSRLHYHREQTANGTNLFVLSSVPMLPGQGDEKEGVGEWDLRAIGVELSRERSLEAAVFAAYQQAIKYYPEKY